MAKIIYCFKIYLFRGQFKLTSRETKQLLEFVALLYTKQWYTTSSSVAAPANDLSFLKKLEAYKSYADDISTTAAKALKRHLWYLSEELVGLSLFSEDVPPEVKKEMVLGLSRELAKKSVKRLEGASLKQV